MDAINPNHTPSSDINTGSGLDPVGFLLKNAFPQIYKYIDDKDKLNRRELQRIQRDNEKLAAKSATLDRQNASAQSALKEATAGALRKVTRDAEAAVRRSDEEHQRTLERYKKQQEKTYNDLKDDVKKARAAQINAESTTTADLKIALTEIGQNKRLIREKISEINKITDTVKGDGVGKVKLSSTMTKELADLKKQLADIIKVQSDALTNFEMNIKSKNETRKQHNIAEADLAKRLPELTSAIENFGKTISEKITNDEKIIRDNASSTHSKVSSADLLKNPHAKSIIGELGDNAHSRKMLDQLGRITENLEKQSKLSASHKMASVAESMAEGGFKALIAKYLTKNALMAAIAVGGAVGIGVTQAAKGAAYGLDRLSGSNVNRATRNAQMAQAFKDGDEGKVNQLLKQGKQYEDWVAKGAPPVGGSPRAQQYEGGITPQGRRSRRGGGGGDAVPLGGPAPEATPGGSPFLASKRQKYIDELNNDPALKDEFMRAIHAEAGGKREKIGDVMESAFNRADMRGHSLKKEIHSGFFGPVNRGDSGFTNALSPKDRRSSEGALADVGSGRNHIKLRTDQGMINDPGARRYEQMPDRSGALDLDGEGGNHYYYMGSAGRRWAAKTEAERKAYDAKHDTVGVVTPPAIAAMASRHNGTLPLAGLKPTISPERAAEIVAKGGATQVGGGVGAGPLGGPKKAGGGGAWNPALGASLLTPIPGQGSDATPVVPEQKGFFGRMGDRIKGAGTSLKNWAVGVPHYDRKAPHTKEEADAEALRLSALAVDNVGKLSGLADNNPAGWAKIQKFMKDGGVGLSTADKEWCAKTYQAAYTQVGLKTPAKPDYAANWASDPDYRKVDPKTEALQKGMLGVHMPTRMNSEYGKAVGLSGHLFGVEGFNHDGQVIRTSGNTRFGGPDGPHGIIAGGLANPDDARPIQYMVPTGKALTAGPAAGVDVDDHGALGRASNWVGDEYNSAKSWVGDEWNKDKSLWNGPDATPVDQNPTAGSSLDAAGTANEAAKQNGGTHSTTNNLKAGGGEQKPKQNEKSGKQKHTSLSDDYLKKMFGGYGAFC